MNEHDLAMDAGCVGGPHLRGTSPDCEECRPFWDNRLSVNWGTRTSKHDDYQSLLRGEITSTEYVARLRASIIAEGIPGTTPREIDRLRAENEALIRSWNIDAEYRDDVIKAAEAVIADWDRYPQYEPVSGAALRAQIRGEEVADAP